jgi:hypothetical protein
MVGRLLLNPIFWIPNTIQIHHKYVINNLNALFKIGLTIKSKSSHSDFKKNFNYIDLFMNSQLHSHAFFKKIWIKIVRLLQFEAFTP